MRKAIFHDKTGKKRLWEFVERKDHIRVVTVICRSVLTGKILLVSQPRIPIGALEISFPAGLVEEGESVEEAALRELREETGYNADIISIREGLPKSAGLTSESTSLVFCETDEIAWSEPDMDDTEEITSMWMEPSVFFDFIKGVDPNKVRVAYDTYCYMLGTQLGDL